MRALLMTLAVVAVLILAIAVLGVIGPFIAGVGLLTALVVLLNPGGVGARLRSSPGWWGIPGMRTASRSAASFAALLLLYALPVPLGAFAILHSANNGGQSSSNPVAGVNGGLTPSPSADGVGGGSTASSPTATPEPTAVPTAIPTPAPTPVPTAAPTAPPPTAKPPPPPTPRPTPTPNLCGAPPNPWNYNFCGGGTISSPPDNFCDYFSCIESFWQSTKGYVEECADGQYSHSGGRSGSCSSHGGNRRPLNP